MAPSLIGRFAVVGLGAMLAMTSLVACSDGPKAVVEAGVDGAAPPIDAAIDAAIDAPPGTDPLPLVTGGYVGTYRVPVPPALEAAAIFAVAQVDWTILDGCGSFATATVDNEIDHLTSLSAGRLRGGGSGLGTSPSA